MNDQMSENGMARRIRATRDAPSQARRMIGGLASDLGHRLDDVALVLSELVTNSVVHGGAAGDIDGDIDFSLSVGNTIRLEVTDTGSGFDETELPVGKDNGLGLVLVDRLSQDWGVARDGNRFTVWVEIPKG